MSYTPTQWKSGDVVTSEKLNKIEDGIAGANLFVVTITFEETGEGNDELIYHSDKTAAEINEAFNAGRFPVVKLGDCFDEDINILYPCRIAQFEGDEYFESYAYFTLAYTGASEILYGLTGYNVMIEMEGDSEETAEQFVHYYRGHGSFYT